MTEEPNQLNEPGANWDDFVNSSPSPRTIGQVSIRLEKASMPDLDWEF